MLLVRFPQRGEKSDLILNAEKIAYMEEQEDGRTAILTFSEGTYGRTTRLVALSLEKVVDLIEEAEVKKIIMVRDVQNPGRQ